MEKSLPQSMPDGNYIDIYKAKSTKEFYQLITTPIPCCGYCNKKAQKFGEKGNIPKNKLTNGANRKGELAIIQTYREMDPAE